MALKFRSRMAGALLAVVMCAGSAPASVFLSEIFFNPPGSFDDSYEFIELMGTPGMKLDGYGIAVVSGALQKYYPLGSIPPIPVEAQEIDEFFSLDGLALGKNGILVLGIGNASDYPTLLPDTAFRPNWDSGSTPIWNGMLDTPGKLENDGSKTVFLIRNRPGVTQADPANPLGLRWGKDINPDAELVTPVEDQDGAMKDQWGDGSLDKGQEDGVGGFTFDMRGFLTLEDPSDDLEVVDEISLENEQGWEYDVDDRKVNVGIEAGKFKERRVHALGDPQGFNPDAISRVDYRTKGAGWTPAGGATGEQENGNNWQDMATEQWVRGESVGTIGGQGVEFYYSNLPNTNPDAYQPFLTNVPLWLTDGQGTDFDFATTNSYRVMAGRVNPLAVPFIPGDTDRDGDSDLDDIAKIAQVFGDPDWIFSNSFKDAPEGDSGDPAAQIRPWDADLNAVNGVDPSDLQWVLNFQGDTTGRIIGVTYDSATPSAVGVALNSNAGTAVTISAELVLPPGRTAATLQIGDDVDLVVKAQVTGGANLTAGQQNGVMQYAHDVIAGNTDVLQVTGVTPAAPFHTTRASLETLLGNSGDGGIAGINGYTTSFTQGLASPGTIYAVHLTAIAAGTASWTISPAASTFEGGIPLGVKLGHTDQTGDPAGANYPGSVELTVLVPTLGNCDGDGDVDASDYACFPDCLTGPDGSLESGCEIFDFDNDTDVDLLDFADMTIAFTAP